MHRRLMTLLFLLTGSLFLSSIAYAFKMESDSITLPDPVAFQTVNFKQAFDSVPVVFILPDNTDPRPAYARIRNVTTTGFEIAQVTPPGSVGSFSPLNIHYLAIEQGQFQLDDGTKIDVGSLSTSTVQHGRGVSGAEGWDLVSFNTSFSTTATVLANIQTMANEPAHTAGDASAPWLTAAVRNVSATAFEVALGRAEANNGSVTSNETIAYMAVESGSAGTFTDNNSNTISYEFIRTTDSVRGWGTCFSASFAATYSNPMVIGNPATHDGGDGGWLRRCSLSVNSTGLSFDEDTDRDSERNHTTERASLMIFSESFDFNGGSVIAPPPAPVVDPVWKMEADSIDLPAVSAGSTSVTSVTFRQTYDEAPVVVVLPSTQNSQPQSVRIQNITTTGFEIVSVEPPGETAGQTASTVHYLAVEPGIHTLGTDTIVEAFTVDTQSYQTKLLGGTSYETITLQSSFTTPPAILSQVQTINNEAAAIPGTSSTPWLETTVKNASTSAFQVALERAEVSAGTISNDETIGYIAFASAKTDSFTDNDSNTITYETIRSNDVITGNCSTVNFANTYSSIPLVVASQNTRDGGDGGWLRRCNTSTTGVALEIDEDRTNDSERNHTTERAGIVVFSSAFDVAFLPDDPLVFSTSGAAAIGGVSINDGDIAIYDPVAATLTVLLNETSFTGTKNEDIDAVHLLTDGRIIFSTTGDASIGGLDFAADDLVLYDLSADSASLYFEGDTIFSRNNEDIDAVYVRDNGNILLSTTGNATINGINFAADDIVEYNPSTGTANIIFDGSSAALFATNEDIDGLHVTDSGNYLLSTANSATLGGLSFDSGDVIEYNAAADTATLYFAATTFDDNSENIDAVSIDNRVLSALDHFAIAHSGNAVTCEAEPVTITAHQSATDHTLVHTTYTGTITLNTSDNTGDWSINTGAGTLTNGTANDGQATYTFAASDSGQVILDLAHPAAGNVNINISGDGKTETADNNEDLDLVFSNTAFRFYADGVNNAISTKISGKDSNIASENQLLTIKAVQTNPVSGACSSVLSGNHTIQMAIDCESPATCNSGSTILINGTAVSKNSNNNVSAYGGVDLNFTNSEASFMMNYSDAGQIQLHAQYTIPASGGNPETTLTGSSNSFVVKPAGLCVESNTANAACGTADETCSVFVDAGDPFSLRVKGVAWSSNTETNAQFCDNAITPNFQLANIALSSNLVAPAGGTLVQPTVTSVDIAANGTVVETNQAINEVGVFTITATPPLYLGQSIAASTSDNIGRFTPDRLLVTVNAPSFRNGTAGWACGFTYMQQEFTYAVLPQVTITGQNAGGGTTNNYDSNFWMFNGSFSGRTYTDTTNVTDISLEITTTGTITESDVDNLDGDRLYTWDTNDLFRYLKQTNLVAPFSPDVDLNFTINDLTDADNKCYDSNADGTCETYSLEGISGNEIRFGRMLLSNTTGTEFQDLNLPISAQYFDGAVFVMNTADSCTSYNSTDVSFANPSGNLSAGDMSASGAGDLIAGVYDPANPVILTAPGAGKDGSIDAIMDLSGQTWLQYDWDNDGTHDNNPSARITFGIFQGSDRQIYIREILR